MSQKSDQEEFWSLKIATPSFFFYKNAETRVTALLTSLEDNLVAVAGGGLQIWPCNFHM